MQRAFDRIEVHTAAGEVQALSPEQYEALPLAERVKLLMGGGLRFYRNGQQIATREALKDG